MTAMPLEQDDLDHREKWRADALDMIQVLATTCEDFSADDLYDMGLPPQPGKNLLQAAFQDAARAGWVHTSGVKRSRRRARKGGWTAVWCGNIHMLNQAA